MAVEIGALRALLSLDSAAFERGAKRAQASMSGLQRSLSKAADRMKKTGRTMTTRMTAPIVAGTGLLVRSSLKTIDAQAKMAESMDTSVSSLQVLARASETAGISQGDLEGSLRRMTRRISLAAQGTGAGAKAFERLGIAAEDFTELDAAERIALIQERLAEMVPEAERAGVASQIFGDKTGLAMTRLDPSVIASAAQELERFGVTVSEVDADKIEKANDAMSAIGLVTRGLGNQLAVALAPTLQAIAERIADLGAWFADLSPRMKNMIGIGTALAAALGPVLLAVGFLATGLAALASPIGLVVLGLGAAIGVAVAVAANWDTLVKKFPALGEAAERVGNALSAAWEGIKEQTIALKDTVNGLLDGIIGIITGDLPSALEGFKESLAGLNDFLRSTVTAWVGIFGALLPGVSEALADVRQAVVDEFNEIMDWLREIPSRMKEIGSDMIQGMIDGIKSRTPNLGAEAAAAGRGAENAARRQLETQSPSRVFMRIGRDLMAGLGIGVQEGAESVNTTMQSAAQQISSQVEGIGDSFDRTGDRFGDMVADIATGARTASDILSDLGNRLKSSAISGIANSIFGGTGIGNLFAGLFDQGGMIPAGKFGIAGERGPEIVTGPARVTSRADTARIMGGGARVSVPIQVNIQKGAERDEVRRRRGPSGQEIIDVAVSDSISGGRQDTVFGARFGAQPQTVRR